MGNLSPVGHADLDSSPGPQGPTEGGGPGSAGVGVRMIVRLLDSDNDNDNKSQCAATHYAAPMHGTRRSSPSLPAVAPAARAIRGRLPLRRPGGGVRL